MNSHDYLDRYYKILDLISEMNNKLLEIDQSQILRPIESHRMIYDQIYMLECLIFSEIKKIEADLKKEKLKYEEKFYAKEKDQNQ